MKLSLLWRVLVWSLPMLACNAAALAAASDVRVGNVTFTMPAGWQLAPGVPEEQGRMLIPADAAGGQPKGVIMVFRDTELTGTFQAAFAGAVAAAAQQRKVRQGGEVVAARDPKGTPLLAQSVLYENGTYIAFLAANFGRRMALVCCITTDEPFFRQLVKTEYELVAGMRFAGQPATATAPAASQPAPTTRAAAGDEGKVRAP